MGTPEIAVESLDFLNKSEEIEVCAVVTQMDRPKGRGNKLTPPPIKEWAIANNVPCFQPEKISKDAELIETLKAFDMDFFVTFALIVKFSKGIFIKKAKKGKIKRKRGTKK